jgi:hypothetical protein
MTFPTVRPARRVHVPPPPSGLLPEPGGRTPAERAHRLQQQTADLYTRWRGSFPNGIDPDELKDAAGQFAYTDQALALPDALQAVKDEADAANAKVSDLIKGQKVAGDVGSQIAAQRYWDRSRRTLDSIKDGAKAVAAAQNLIASASDSQVPVLAEELGDYLAQRSLPAGWLPDALSQKIPGLSDAQADAITKERQLAILQQNHQALTNAMAKDIAVPPLLDPSRVSSEPYGDYE